ncbi:MAG: PKD domain-containing protein [Bacteroidota bacterium]
MKTSTFWLLPFLLFGLMPSAKSQLGGPNGSGQWSAVIPLSIVPVAAANLPNGKIVAWSAYDRFRFGGNRGKTYTIIFDPATNSSQEMLISNTQHDMFCPGTSNLPDGKVIVTGGSSSTKTSIYDPATNQWSAAAPMKIPRGYHAMVTLADGKVFTIGGSWSGNASQRSNKQAEVYENDSWTLLNGLPGNLLYKDAVAINSHWLKDSHTWLWPAPNGKVFHAGPNNNMHWLDVNGNGSFTSAGKRGTDGFINSGTTVMYDKGKILKVGGASITNSGTTVVGSTYIIDINTNQAVVKQVQSLTHKRTRHNSVVLPTGEVLAVGGLGVDKSFSDQDSKLIPELWDPQTETWRGLAPMQTPRNYHSIALLMMDGRVFAGGGGLCNTCTVNHPDAEIFSPPYLFNANGSLATRPVISGNSDKMLTESQEIITTNSAVTYFSLIRYSSVTHSTNNEQRRIKLATTSLGNNRYQIQLPDHNVAIPGQYMLFAINPNGTPSVAKLVQVLPKSDCEPQSLSQAAFKSYGSNQDFGTATVQNAGKDVLLRNNAWKYMDLPYNITANTVLTFEFKSSVQGEIAAIGMDNDNTWSPERAFKLYGTQGDAALITDFEDYTPNAYKKYTIPIGQYYRGAMNRLFFIMDHDGGAKNGNAYFRNVKVSEEGVCSEPVENLAYRRPATQSSTYRTGVASLAVDGFSNGLYTAGSVTHTSSSANPWWRVNLEDTYQLNHIEISNRTDCCGNRLAGTKVLVGDTPSNNPADYTEVGVLTAAITQRLTNISATGQYIMLYLPGNNKILSLAEVRAYGSKCTVSSAVTNITTQAESCGDGKGKITFSFTDQPGSSHLEFSLDGGNTYKAQVADNSGSVSYTVAPGSYDLFVRWGDDSCPTSLGTKTVAVDPAPNVTSIQKENVNCDTGKGKITFNFTDVASRTGIEFSLDGGTIYKAQVNDNSGSVSYDVDAGTYSLFVRWGNNECPVDLGSKTVTENCNNPPPNGECFVLSNTDQVAIEAENFSRTIAGTGNAASTNWTEISETNASGGKAIQAGPNQGLWTGLNLFGPSVEYDIDFTKTGVYYVYVRSQGPTANDDSYHIGLNGSGLSNKSAYGMGGSGPWSWQNLANDDEQMQLNIQSVGKHTLNIWVREDGVQIDKIVIKKANGAPTGKGPNASAKSPCGGNANQAPIARFTASPSSGAAPLQVSMNASSSSDSDGSISSYAWDFGDGAQGSGKNASHTYTSVGTYTLRLTVTDNQGLSNTSSRTIRANPPANGPLCFEEINGKVVIEAENFSSTSAGSGNASSSNWQKFTDINASNSEGVRAVPNNGVWTGLSLNGPRLDYKVRFQTAGTYRVYIRTQGPTNQDDSYHIGLNGSSVSTTNGYGMGWTGSWGWAYFANEDEFVEVLVPSTGEHTFNIWMREDGVEIDKIVMKIQPGIPSAQGPAASAQVECSTPNNFANNTKSFSIKESGGNGEINWGNFFEEFKDTYVLERSIDGVTYESLESEEIIVDQILNTHTDPQIRQYGVGAVFYRLRIKDQTGVTRETRRGVLKIGSDDLLFNFTVYPNPATDKLNLEFDNASGNALNLTIMNSLGQSIYTNQIDANQTDGMIRMDVSEYAQGIYFIRLSDKDNSKIVRVLIE